MRDLGWLDILGVRLRVREQRVVDGLASGLSGCPQLSIKPGK